MDTEKKAREIQEKTDRVRAFMHREGLDGVCLLRSAAFSWITGGGNGQVVTGSDRAVGLIMILQDRKILVAGCNEIGRLMEEQVAGQDFEPVTHDWFHSQEAVVAELIKGLKIASDLPYPCMIPMGAAITRLRYQLTEAEMERADEIATICSDEVANVCRNLKAGFSEKDIAAELTYNLLKQGVRPAVLLVGTDQRAFLPHPVPSPGKKLEHYALIGMVGEKNGLHIAVTRSAYIGKLPASLKKHYEVALAVEASLFSATVPGNILNKAFNQGLEVYDRFGLPKEWKKHHQGGSIGYAPRECRADQSLSEEILLNQMFAWNPTVQGTKTEETIITTNEGAPRIMTPVQPWWPVTTVTINGQDLVRSLILELYS